MKCFRILSLFFFIISTIALNAQSVKDFNIYNFTNDNGLPQNSVKAIALDGDNYMWIATESGLVRYDGRNFRIYSRNNMNILYSNRISYTGIMHDRKIYFVDDNSNVYLKDHKDQFTKLPQKANSNLLINVKLGLYEPAVHLGIAAYNYLNAQFISNWTNNITFFQTNDSTSGFISVNKNIVAYVARKKVIRIDSIKNYNRHVNHGSGTLNGRLYFLDEDFRLTSLDTLGKIQKVQLCGLKPGAEPHKRLPAHYSLLQQEDKLYLLYDNNIYEVSYINEKTARASLLIEAKGIPDITCFRSYPNLGTYAIGSGTKGLFLLKKKQFKTLTFPETDNIFYAQAIYRDTGVLTNFGILMPHSAIKFPLEKIKKQAIFRDREGNYWLNKAAESILKIKPDFTVLREIKLKDLFVTCFTETADGNIWFITNKNKLGKIDNNGIEWLSIQLSPNSMFTILPIDTVNFWIGGNRHLFRINVRTRHIIHYNYFRDCDIRCLYLDKRDILWIGTYGKGYFALKDKKLVRLPVDTKGALSVVHAILEDKKGNVWMTTNNGILQTTEKNLENYIAGRSASVYYQYFTKEEGFNTNEFNGGCTPSGLEFEDGRISFPSMNGLVQFYPDSIKEAYPTSKIFIDDFLVDGKTVPIEDNVVLPPDFNRMEITISSPYYDNPANQQIEYKLKDFDEEWYPLSNNNTITYNRLPYGVYSLLLRKKAGFTTNYYITSHLRFTIKPFFYQEWFFKVLAVLLFILLLLLFFRLRYFILIKKQRKLEHKVQQRTRELVYNNRLKEKLTLLIAHDLQSPLHFLTILTQHVHKAALNNDIASVLEGSEEIKNTTAKIYSFVKEFSLWNMSLNENYRLNKTRFPINTLIEELKQFFEEMMRLKNNTLEIRQIGETVITTDRDVLKAILRNIIDNANKYTQNGRITITVARDKNNCMMLSIKDTGNGMTEQQLEKINYRIRQAPSIPAIEKDGRLGFQLIIDFAARLEAELHVTSTINQGTTITVSGFICED